MKKVLLFAFLTITCSVFAQVKSDEELHSYINKRINAQSLNIPDKFTKNLNRILHDIVFAKAHVDGAQGEHLIDTLYYYTEGDDGDSLYVKYGCYTSGDRWIFISDTIFVNICYVETDPFYIQDSGSYLKASDSNQYITPKYYQDNQPIIPDVSGKLNLSDSNLYITPKYYIDNLPDISGKINTGDSNIYVTPKALSNFGYLTAYIETDPYRYTDTSSYYKKTVMNNILNGYLTTNALTGYATTTWVGQQGYLTTSPPEVDAVWLSDSSGYYPKTVVDNKLGLYAPLSSLSGYATTGDLSGGLSGKANTSHAHAISEVTNLQTTLDGKATSSHAHAISDVTNLQITLDGKQATLENQVNIKSVNGVSLVGSGDVVISGSGNGYCLGFQCLTSSMASATTYYIGNEPFAASTTQTINIVDCPKAGTIKAASIRFRRTNGTYTSGNFIMSVNVNNVATQIASVANFNTPLVFSNASLNIPVVYGDDLQIKVLTPTLSVAGTACFVSGNIYIE
jgi:hypothetical protein